MSTAKDVSQSPSRESISERSEYINEPPTAQQDMSLEPVEIIDENETENRSHRDSGSTYSSFGSGYDRDTNECTDFCLDFSTCFGLLDDCCPADGDGCITTTATFCGNILFSCRKC